MTTEILKRSLILDFFSEKKVQSINPVEQKKLGETLSDRAEQIYQQTKTLRVLFANAYKNPARFGTSVAAILYGLSDIYQGNFFSGGATALMGGAELYHQCMSEGKTTLDKLLNEIQADVETFSVLEQGQRERYDVVQGNLDQVHVSLKSLYDKLDTLANVNTQGIQELEKGKRIALQKAQEAKKAYRTALEAFTQAQRGMSQSKEIYQKCADYFLQIQALAKSTDSSSSLEEKVEALITKAKKASDECGSGRIHLEQADQKYNEGMKAFAHALHLKEEALEQMTKVTTGAELSLKMGLEKTQYSKECQEKIEATQVVIQEIKQTSDDITQLLVEMAQEVQQAKSEAEKKYNPSDFAVGLGTGITLASFGLVPAAVAGFTAATAWHNRSSIADTTRKVYQYFMGGSVPVKEPMREDELTRLTMDPISSGIWGSWVKRRGSHTYGTYEINLGKESISLRVDLSNPQYPISKEALFTLYKTLVAQLEQGKMKPERCQEILKQMEEIKVPRLDPETGRQSVIRGFIKGAQAGYGLFARSLNVYCEKLKAVR